jgi:uncharacterized OsmC-like protein
MKANQTASASQKALPNGIDVEKLTQAVDAIATDAKKGMTSWGVTTSWKGGTRSDSRVTAFSIGGETVKKDFTIPVDEPVELCGENKFPNPQEYLLAALNACMVVGYAAGAALEGVNLRELRIQTSGNIDLRGFLGLDPAVKPGYESIKYTVYIKSDGSPEQIERIHDRVSRTSPNRFNLAQPIRLDGRVVAE